MCLLLVAHDCCPGYRLLVAANRDEFHDRPTAAAEWWADRPDILGGRDLEAGGTWLALDRHGRFATITNVRAGRIAPGQRSRGLIVNDFLAGDDGADAFTATLARDGAAYAGFNVLAYDGDSLSWYSNAAGAPRTLERGIYTLSNAQLDTAWPKTERLRAGFGRMLAEVSHATPAASAGVGADRGPGAAPDDIVATLLDLLRDDVAAHDHALPDTGIGLAMERVLSSIFIRGPHYGTRCSTVILIDEHGQLTYHERRYDRDAAIAGDTRISFELPGPAA
ncbi:MAG: NRDE family protein [Gammaproteobacteria bacterium]|nr:NRDE family protein [Gammaproteobacteria bacterium]MCP5202094.1 NRDE family protein [Gammaproteobacteria bacterium]